MFTLRRTLATLVGTLSALVTLTAVGSNAYAQRQPLTDDSNSVQTARTVGSASHGSPLWVFAVVAIAAAVLTLAAVLATMKLRHASRPSTAPA
jgi:hypothetical protein